MSWQRWVSTLPERVSRSRPSHPPAIMSANGGGGGHQSLAFYGGTKGNPEHQMDRYLNEVTIQSQRHVAHCSGRP